MSFDDLPSRIREFLMRRGAPASSLLLAERFLKVLPRSDELALRLLAPLLGPAGMVHLPDTGWWIGGPPDATTARPPAEPDFPGRQVACAVALAFDERSTARRARITEIHLREIGLPSPDGVEETRAARAVVSRLDWGSISAILAGAAAVFVDPKKEAPLLLAGLVARSLPGPSKVRSLAAWVRGSARIARGSGVEGICEALGTPYRDAGSPEDAALNIEACAIAAFAIRSGRTQEAPPKPRGGSPVLGPEFLRRVPSRPGVYRFFDEGGRLLYVGKAADLKRRLSSYASPAARGAAGRATRALRRLARVEFEIAGSELEALMKEARLIRLRAPLDNVQRGIHERRHAYASSRRVALLLPSRGAGTVTVLFVEDGRYEGSAKLGPMGGGVATATSILRRLFAARPRRRRGIGATVERESQILKSFMARDAESVSRVDLDSSRDAAGAVRSLLLAADQFSKGEEGASLHRPARRRP